MTIILLLIAMVPAVIGAIVASVLFDVALRHGVFGRTADGTPPRIRKLYLSTVPIGFVAAYIALVIAMSVPHHLELIMLIASGVLAGLFVLAIKFTSLRCAIRRARRATREPLDTDTHEFQYAAPIVPAPHA